MNTIAEHGKNCSDFASKVEKDFSWVSVEKAGFGSGDYNFANYDMRKSKKDYAEVCFGTKRIGMFCRTIAS